MRMLVMDTCGAEGMVGVASEDGVVAEEVIPGRETSSLLIPAVRRVMAAAGVGFEGLDAIAVVHGPGSFTGVRVGVASAKAFAEATGVRVIAVSRLAVVAAKAASAGVVRALLDAGRGDVYLGVFGAEGEAREQIVSGDAVEGMVGLVMVEAALARRFGGAMLLSPLTVEDIWRVALRQFGAGAFVDSMLLNALYLRVPDAELALRAAGGSGR